MNEDYCPFDNATKTNLRFLIAIRHEIEHQMTNSIDDAISSKLQACVFNYNYYLKTLFGNKYSIDKELSLAISIGGVDPTALKKNVKGLNENLTKFISEFEENLPEDVFKSTKYSYKIMYIPISTSKRGQADKAIEFLKLTEEQKDKIHDIVLVKNSERPKYKPKAIVEMMRKEGYKDFTINKHTKIWKELKEKGVDLSSYRIELSDGNPYWYENWIECVRIYCAEHFKKQEIENA